MSEVLKKLIESRKRATQGEWKPEPAKSFCGKEVIEAGLCRHSKIVTRNCSTGEETIDNCTGGNNENWQEVDGPTYYGKDADWIYNNIGQKHMHWEDAFFISEAANSIEQIGKDYDSAQKKIEAQGRAIERLDKEVLDLVARYVRGELKDVIVSRMRNDLKAILNTQEGK